MFTPSRNNKGSLKTVSLVFRLPIMWLQRGVCFQAALLRRAHHF
ncbi:hypothetical protein [Kingella sp. (in: b-proteobacteria)]|nr:hypothetical protein [Kingella sp. (in: b-proteobacteria)]MDO4656757.1 hypothetical protein [Kingella sp. (in: b-proteobacteria)]